MKSQVQGLDFRMKDFLQLIQQKNLITILVLRATLPQHLINVVKMIPSKHDSLLPTLSATNMLPTKNHSLLPRPSATVLR